MQRSLRLDVRAQASSVYIYPERTLELGIEHDCGNRSEHQEEECRLGCSFGDAVHEPEQTEPGDHRQDDNEGHVDVACEQPFGDPVNDRSGQLVEDGLGDFFDDTVAEVVNDLGEPLAQLIGKLFKINGVCLTCLLYTSPSPRDS